MFSYIACSIFATQYLCEILKSIIETLIYLAEALSMNLLCFLIRLCGCTIAVRIIEKPFKMFIVDASKSKKREA